MSKTRLSHKVLSFVLLYFAVLSICCCCCRKIDLFKINHKKLQKGWKTIVTHYNLLLAEELSRFVRYFPKIIVKVICHGLWCSKFMSEWRMCALVGIPEYFLWGSANEKFSRARRKDLGLNKISEGTLTHLLFKMDKRKISCVRWIWPTKGSGTALYCWPL